MRPSGASEWRRAPERRVTPMNKRRAWLLCTALLAGSAHAQLFHDVRGESFNETHDFNVVTRNGLLFFVPALLALLVTYCRNVDYSLFKRNVVYRVLRPLVKLIDWVPSWVLYLIVPCMLMFPV